MSFAKASNEKNIGWEKYLLAIIVSFLAFFIGMVIAAKLMQSFPGGIQNSASSAVFAVQLSPYLFGFVGVLLSVRFILNRPILSVFTSRKKFDWQRFFFAFGLWFTFQLVFLIMGLSSNGFITYEIDFGKLFPLLLVSLTLLPIQTAFEDVLYRGLLFQGVTKGIGRAGIAILAVAALFGLMHAGNPEIDILGKVALVYYMVSGLFLGLLAHFDDGLELGMGYHFANNFFGAFVLTNTWQVFQTNAIFTDHSNPVFGWEMWIPLVVLQPLLLYAFYRIYRWKNPLKRILE